MIGNTANRVIMEFGVTEGRAQFGFPFCNVIACLSNLFLIKLNVALCRCTDIFWDHFILNPIQHTQKCSSLSPSFFVDEHHSVSINRETKTI